MADVIIYSARICPFCHRSRLALREKGIDFELVEIDLNDKPEWYSELSPFGTVPALRHGEVRLWESAIINEYLEEAFPTPALMPRTPGLRARARIWIDFAGSRFVPPFYRLLKEQDENRWPQHQEEIREVFAIMEKEGIGRLGGQGPYWLGGDLSLVDLAYYPWFERWPALEHYRQLALPDEFPRLRRWQEAMLERRAVQEAMEPDQFYLEGYRDYAEGEEMRRPGHGTLGTRRSLASQPLRRH